MGKYTTIFWDLDQTLLNFNKSQDYAFRRVFAQYGLPVDEKIVAQYAAINQSYWKRLELGEITKAEVTVGRFFTLFQELHIDHIKPEEFNGFYQEALGSVYFYMDGAEKLVRTLRQAGFRQYIVTNGVNATQASKVRRSGLDRIMDGVFVSELIGYPKPMKAFFDGCFAALPDTKRADCILVGDSLTSDMRGANNAGIAACWFNPERMEKEIAVQIDYEIRRLEEILPILGQA